MATSEPEIGRLALADLADASREEVIAALEPLADALSA